MLQVLDRADEAAALDWSHSCAEVGQLGLRRVKQELHDLVPIGSQVLRILGQPARHEELFRRSLRPAHETSELVAGRRLREQCAQELGVRRLHLNLGEESLELWLRAVVEVGQEDEAFGCELRNVLQHAYVLLGECKP